jgi:hypothetical protein
MSLVGWSAMRALLLALALVLAALAVVPTAEAVTMDFCLGGDGYCREVVCISTDDMNACPGQGYFPCYGAKIGPQTVTACLGNGPGGD